MTLLTLSVAALAHGCPLELERFDRGLRGDGFFVCDGLSLGPAGAEESAAGGGATGSEIRRELSEAYAASRRLHARGPSDWLRSKPTKEPQRWWFTAVEERPLPGEHVDVTEGDAEGDDDDGLRRGAAADAAAVRTLDRRLASVAAVLAAAACATLGLRRPTVLGGSAMLRGLRYARSTAPGQFGIPAHIDFGDFTLCHSDCEGLEAWAREPEEWQRFPAGELCFLAASGLERKSKGGVKAVQHRVNQAEGERMSFCRLHGVPAAHRRAVESQSADAV